MSQSESLKPAMAIAEKIKASGQNCPEYGTNAGHGHVWRRPDGSIARCGGPGLCKQCAADKQRCGGYQPSHEELLILAEAITAWNRRPSTAARGGEVGVKALEWRHPLRDSDMSCVDTIVGVYRVWTHHEANGKWFWHGPEGFNTQQRLSSSDEAKAAAQADYIARIRSALATTAGDGWRSALEAIRDLEPGTQEWVDGKVTTEQAADIGVKAVAIARAALVTDKG